MAVSVNEARTQKSYGRTLLLLLFQLSSVCLCARPTVSKKTTTTSYDFATTTTYYSMVCQCYEYYDYHDNNNIT